MPERVKVTGTLIERGYDERSLLSWVFLHALTEKEIREHDPRDWPELSKLRNVLWMATSDYYKNPEKSADREKAIEVALEAAKALVDRASKEGHEKTTAVSAKRDETDTVEIVFSVNGVELPVVKSFEDLGAQLEDMVKSRASKMIKDTVRLERLRESIEKAEYEIDEALRKMVKEELGIEMPQED